MRSIPDPVARGSAHARFERDRDGWRDRRRRAMPHLAAIGATAVLASFFGLQQVGGPWPFVGAGVVTLLFVMAVLTLPQHIAAWGVGAEGERLTAKALISLEAKGYVVLHDRRLPGRLGNVDHVVIGPTGSLPSRPSRGRAGSRCGRANCGCGVGGAPVRSTR